MAEIVLNFINVSRRYNLGQSEVFGVRDINLAFSAGEFTALVGPSGSGKSTLQHLGAGFDRPSAGRVELLGMDISTYKERELARVRNRRIGFIFQSFNLIPVMSVLENVTYPADINPGPAAFSGTAKARGRELLALVGLQDHAHKRPHQLSGGQRQRVAIARALMNHPALIFADEPTANLDHRVGAEILDILENLNRQLQATIIFATHDPSVIARARRTVRLQDGQVLEDRS